MMRIIIFTFAICLFVDNTFAQFNKQLKLTLSNNKIEKPLYLKKDSINLSYDSSKLGYKSPILAFSLSFLVPGLALGQFYNGQVLNGAIRIAVSLSCVAWFWLSPWFDTGGGGDSSQKILAVSFFAINWISSAIDALVYAIQKNKKNELTRTIYKIK